MDGWQGHAQNARCLPGCKPEKFLLHPLTTAVLALGFSVQYQVVLFVRSRYSCTALCGLGAVPVEGAWVEGWRPPSTQ